MTRFSRGALALLLVVPLALVGCRSGASIEVGGFGVYARVTLAGPDPAAKIESVAPRAEVGTVQTPAQPPTDATPKTDPPKSTPQ